MNGLKIGADPELFLVDAAGALVSAIDRIGGTKDMPRPLPIGNGFAVQEDNVALEYNIPPAENKIGLRFNIAKAMNYLSDMVAEQDLHFSHASSAVFPEPLLEDPRALEFGCEPDFNAWKNGEVNPKPKANDWRLRSCGGHIHVGFPFLDNKELMEFIKHMDLFLGVPSVLMDKGEDRKQLYGKRGAFRPKPYGGEYRVLSNFWVLSPKLCDWVWDSTSMALDAWHNKKINLDAEDDLILAAIDGNSKDIAAKLVDKYRLNVVL